MRPQIPEAMASRIHDIYKKAGYGSESELVRDAVRRRLTELEEKYGQPNLEYAEFEYEVTSNTSLIELTLTPLESSDLRIGDSGGQHQSIPTLYTETTMITNESMKSELEAIDEVQNGRLTHTGEIQVEFKRDEVEDIQSIVDEVFQTVNRVIQRKEDPVSQVEQAAAKYAVPKDDE